MTSLRSARPAARRTAAEPHRRADAAGRARRRTTGTAVTSPSTSGSRTAPTAARVVDLACGEGYGSAMLARTAKRVVGVDANPEAFEHARAKYPQVTFERNMVEIWQGEVDCGVFLQTIERIQDPDAMLAHIRPPDRARRRCLRLDAQRADTRARKAPSAPAIRGMCASTGPRSTARCASAISSASTCSGSSTLASCARATRAFAARLGPGTLPRSTSPTPFYDRFTPAISARDFVLRRERLDRSPRPAGGAAASLSASR